jgi:hypothetical protein
MIYNNFKKNISIIRNDEKKDKNTIIKFDEIFINKFENTILIKTIVIENTINQSQTYYILVSKCSNNQITIRLDPLTDPKNKTVAVKISLAKIAKQYKNLDPTISVGKTNLEQYLQKE